MVPELGFSVQRQWFPKKSDRNVVCHSPKLKLRKFPFLASLSLKWKCWTENEKLQMHARVRLPLCYLVRDFCVAVLLSFTYARRVSQSRMRSLIDSACLPRGPWTVFRWWCGFWKNPAASTFQTSYAQECHSQRWQKWAVFKSSREIWQLQLFVLEFHFFTWHLIEGEYYWMYIIFLHAHQSMKKYITWERPFPQKHRSKYIKQMLKMAL